MQVKCLENIALLHSRIGCDYGGCFETSMKIKTDNLYICHWQSWLHSLWSNERYYYWSSRVLPGILYRARTQFKMHRFNFSSVITISFITSESIAVSAQSHSRTAFIAAIWSARWKLEKILYIVFQMASICAWKAHICMMNCNTKVIYIYARIVHNYGSFERYKETKHLAAMEQYNFYLVFDSDNEFLRSKNVYNIMLLWKTNGLIKQQMCFDSKTTSYLCLPPVHAHTVGQSGHRGWP